MIMRLVFFGKFFSPSFVYISGSKRFIRTLWKFNTCKKTKAKEKLESRQ